jgi:hypothetical protein
VMVFLGCCEHGNELLESLTDKQYLDTWSTVCFCRNQFNIKLNSVY